jgi:hypothetical protein
MGLELMYYDRECVPILTINIFCWYCKEAFAFFTYKQWICVSHMLCMGIVSLSIRWYEVLGIV